MQYVNITKDAAGTTEMLRHSKGERSVPVIVEGGRVTIRYDGAG